MEWDKDTVALSVSCLGLAIGGWSLTLNYWPRSSTDWRWRRSLVQKLFDFIGFGLTLLGVALLGMWYVNTAFFAFVLLFVMLVAAIGVVVSYLPVKSPAQQQQPPRQSSGQAPPES